MAKIIFSPQDEESWVVSSIGGLSSIKKNNLDFHAKACWTLVRYKLSLNLSDTILYLDKGALTESIISGYKIDVAKWISHEIRDRATRTE